MVLNNYETSHLSNMRPSSLKADQKEEMGVLKIDASGTFYSVFLPLSTR